MRAVIPPIAKEGHIFIAIFAAVTIVAFLISHSLGIIFLALTIWCALFFRDPKRYTPVIKDGVIAPADGIVQSIEIVQAPTELGEELGEMVRIAIFMDVFNVHINRSPVKGNIKNIVYCPGKFFNASLDKASIHNERQIFLINTESKQPVVMVQIAGLVARRIVKFVEPDTDVMAGEKVGLIRFGSRVDVYLPKETIPCVAVGQTMVGGETVLAHLRAKQPEAVTTQILDRAESTVVEV